MAMIGKKIFATILFFICPLIIFYSCEEELDYSDCSTYDYSDCNTIEPEYGKIMVKLTINQENPKVPLVVYSGKLEGGNSVLLDTAYDNSYEAYLPVNAYYTVKAEYLQGSKKIFAIDGDEISKNKTKKCDSVCWSVKNAVINVKLKE